MAEEQPLLSISTQPPAIPQPRVVVEQRNLTLEAFRALADPIRLELLALIAARGPLCVCHLQEELPYTQPRISKHLAVLRRAGLVSVERRGSWAYYSPNLEMIDTAQDFLRQVEQSVRSPHLADSCPEPE
jgi:ArsR family transcriptional regulator, arsenate/arsenite/antimonite-responsive transcriptional repressor